MKKTELKVKGMHCASCETLVKDELEEVAGVKNVYADHAKGIVSFEHEGDAELVRIKAKIKELGYEVV